MIAALATMLLVPVGGAAHDDECIVDLWTYPLEDLELPEGWALSGTRLLIDGSIDLEFAGPVVGQYDSGGDRIASSAVSLRCHSDPAAYMDARARFRELDEPREMRVVPVGDANRATRVIMEGVYSRSTHSTIDWRTGDVVGQLFISEDDEEDIVPWTDLEDIALAVDELLD